MTVTAALTDVMKVTSYRGDKKRTFALIDGEVQPSPIEPLDTYKTGTRVEIIPSEKYLGPMNITTDMVEDYVRNMSYCMESDITVTFIGEKPDKKGKTFTHVYKPQGIAAAVKYMSSSLEFPPIFVKYSCDDYDISLAFSYDRTLDDTKAASFCNYVVTTEGGCHENAATRAICTYFSREAKRQDPNNKTEISFDDCKRGLVYAVNLEHIRPKFEGQHKTRVSNNEIITDAAKGLTNAIFKVMNNNPPVMKKIINYLRTVAKAREESHKIKGVASAKKNTSYLEDAEIDKYSPVSNRNSSGYKEIFLCEGD